ncbi:TonB-dependent receptor [Bizionia gelidisalsuginis]|uniref:TonB-dependent receptor n=1 Tax=Bizionia gelidisalsuginis TaxID=291188 RepID=A0ABY3MB02_9FLAO|nr:TonB-dependent receptor [Bizionia gelidisalsuginis]TYC13479.1 TonB-dependent receptor [Bizionia gelidisalsuginis]
MKYLTNCANKVIFSVLFFALFSFASRAQTIQIVEEELSAPIVGVAVFNKDKTVSEISDFNGEVNLKRFPFDEKIYFKHLAFQLKKIKKSAIKNSRIVLKANNEALGEIVISASRFKQNRKDIPNKIISFNAKSIAFSNPQTSADALENTGQVFIQKSQLGGGSPLIRGFSTNRLLITVDGVRMNNAIFRGGNLQNVIAIDPFSIQKTEVTLGAGSIIYGSDAIGGVMSFYTQKPQLSYSDVLYTKAQAVVRYASANQEKTAHFDVNFGLEKWAFLSHVTYTYFDDLRMGKNGPDDYLRPNYVVTTAGVDVMVKNDKPKLQKHTGYDQINAMQKVRFEPKENLSFDLGLYYTTTSNTPRYDRLIRYDDAVLKSAEWYYGPQRWFMTNVNVTKLSSSSNLYDKIQATVAFQNFQESRIDRNFQSLSRSIKEESVAAVSFNLDLEKKLSDNTIFHYGAEYVYNHVSSIAKKENRITGVTENIVSRYPNGSRWQSAALYSSIKYKPNQKFVFQMGLRYNYITSFADFEENNVYLDLPFTTSKNTADALTGSAGISWLPNNIIHWRFNLSTAFRAPNIDDIGKVFDSEPGAVVVPNTNLKPEYAYGGELGVTLNFNNTVVLDAATYYTYLDNALVRKDGDLNGETAIMYIGELSTVQSLQNASEARVYGFELGTEIKFTEEFKLTSQYSVIGGSETTNTIEVPVRHVAPHFGNTHFIWQNNKLSADAYLKYNSELSFYKLAPSETKKAYLYAVDANGQPYSPAWSTLNFRIQYQFNNAVVLTSSLENITDRRYKTYSSGIAAPGRNLIVSLKYTL